MSNVLRLLIVEFPMNLKTTTNISLAILGLSGVIAIRHTSLQQDVPDAVHAAATTVVHAQDWSKTQGKAGDASVASGTEIRQVEAQRQP